MKLDLIQRKSKSLFQMLNSQSGLLGPARGERYAKLKACDWSIVRFPGF